MDMGCCYSEFHALCDRQTRETLSNNNPCPSSPSSTIYIYIYIYIYNYNEKCNVRQLFESFSVTNHMEWVGQIVLYAVHEINI